MIHKIKALHDNGQGLSIRAISQQLGVSRNTVRKYLRMEERDIATELDNPIRSKRLDDHRDYVVYLLTRYPQLSAVKVARKLRAHVGEIAVSDRSIRRYVRALKEQQPTAQNRYYEPIIDDVPGIQCQVDPGELRGVRVGERERTLYFVVFVLSFSRLMYVGLSFRPLNTQSFIQLHDEAMRYFGGVAQECVYDQTKLVVIDETFRELTLNERFNEYATAAGFRIHACEGYDPESKGKVESGVQYVKRDCLYGEAFRDEAQVRDHIQQWLEEVANARTHGTTGQVPRQHFEQHEREQLSRYLSPECVGAGAMASRKADKTGLIAWQANKYSVPMAWQRTRVGVCQVDEQLHIHDHDSGEVIAVHALCHDKGRVIKNTHHYRDQSQRVANLEADIEALLDDGDTASRLCDQIKRTNDRIYKDQLVAVRQLLREHTPAPELIEPLAGRAGMSATRMRDYLEAAQAATERERVPQPVASNGASPLDLSAYSRLGQPSGQEVTHESA